MLQDYLLAKHKSTSLAKIKINNSLIDMIFIDSSMRSNVDKQDKKNRLYLFHNTTGTII